MPRYLVYDSYTELCLGVLCMTATPSCASLSRVTSRNDGNHLASCGLFCSFSHSPFCPFPRLFFQRSHMIFHRLICAHDLVRATIRTVIRSPHPSCHSLHTALSGQPNAHSFAHPIVCVVVPLPCRYDLCRVVKAATRNTGGTSYVTMLSMEANVAELLGPVTTYVT